MLPRDKPHVLRGSRGWEYGRNLTVGIKYERSGIRQEEKKGIDGPHQQRRLGIGQKVPTALNGRKREERQANTESGK